MSTLRESFHSIRGSTDRASSIISGWKEAANPGKQRLIDTDSPHADNVGKAVTFNHDCQGNVHDPLEGPIYLVGLSQIKTFQSFFMEPDLKLTDYGNDMPVFDPGRCMKKTDKAAFRPKSRPWFARSEGFIPDRKRLLLIS